MSRRILSASTEGETPIFSVRLPPDLAAAVDAVRDDIERTVGIPASRGDVLRLLVKEALAARAAKAPTTTTPAAPSTTPPTAKRPRRAK